MEPNEWDDDYSELGACRKENVRLREIVDAARAYLTIKKSWDNRLPELRRLKQLLEAQDGKRILHTLPNDLPDELHT